MKRLVYNIDDEHGIYTNVTGEKEPPRNGHLTVIGVDVATRYDLYLADMGQVHDHEMSAYDEEQLEALEHCWTSPTVSVRRTKKQIIDAQTVEFKRKCPYCLIHRHSTFDHYFPQAGYSEYTILGKNLVPCCSACNSKKSSFLFNNNGQRRVIHYYLDDIPEVEVLFANAFIQNGLPVVTFELSNADNQMESELFELFQRHFSILHLLDRYTEEAPFEFGECRVDVKANKTDSRDVLREVLMGKVDGHTPRFGVNYFVSAMYRAIRNSDECLDWLLA